MYKDLRFINAGENEFYRYGKKAQEKIKAHLVPNDAGYYSIPADGGKYWTIGTSNGKYGEFAKYNGVFLSVNKGGFVYAKEGTDKADAFVAMIEELILAMEEKNAERADEEE